MILDVAFCKDKRRERAAFDEKIRKYSVLNSKGIETYDRNSIIPIIINYRGYIFGDSRRLL